MLILSQVSGVCQNLLHMETDSDRGTVRKAARHKGSPEHMLTCACAHIQGQSGEPSKTCQSLVACGASTSDLSAIFYYKLV